MIDYIRKKLKSELIKRIFKAITFGIGGMAIAKGILLLINMVIARLLDKQNYGAYSLINNTVQTFLLFASAGLGVTLTRYVALYRDKNKELAGILIKSLLIINIILSAFISIFIFAFSSKLSEILNSNFDISIYLKITAFVIFFASLALIWQSMLQGFEKFKSLAISQIISHVFTLIIGCIITKFWGLMGAIISLLILQIMSLMIMFITGRRIIKEREIKLKCQFNHPEVKEAIKNFTIPAFLSSVFIMPLLWYTNLTFTHVCGYEQYAAFSICVQWLTIINYLPQQLGQVKPIYTQLYDEGKIEEFKKVIYKMIQFSALFSIVISIILGILNQFILGIYGDGYKEAGIAFIIIMITSVFMTVQTQFGAVYQAIGKVWLSFALNAIWAIVFLILFYAFLHYSIIGYALTYLISYMIYGIISYIVFYRKIVIRERKEKMQ